MRADLEHPALVGLGAIGLVQAHGRDATELAQEAQALFGLLMFITLIAGIVARELLIYAADLISIGIVMILVTAVLYWAYLTYIELNVLYAVCQWCVATSIVTVLLLTVEGYRWYLDYKSIGAQ